MKTYLIINFKIYKDLLRSTNPHMNQNKRIRNQR